MSYPPLAEVRKTLRVKWYRVPIERAKLLELSRRSDAQGWFQAGGHLALFMATAALVYLLWWQQLWPAFAIALFAHGTVASFFVGVAPHELGHGTVFRSKWLNKVFMYLFSLISWWDPFDYASSHTYHHRYTLHPEGDRENLLPLEPSLASTFMLQLFTVNLLTQRGRTFGKGGLLSTIVVTIQSAFGVVGSKDVPINEWIEALHHDQPDQARKSMWWSRALLAFHGSLLASAIVTGQWALPLILTVAPFTANWLAYLVGMTQHCGLIENTDDFRKSVRSIRLDPLSEFLYWRMNWHTEHHMYAGVPCYNLKKLYREIAPRDAGTANPAGRLAGDARHLAAAEDRSGLRLRHDRSPRAPDRAHGDAADGARDLDRGAGSRRPEVGRNRPMDALPLARPGRGNARPCRGNLRSPIRSANMVYFFHQKGGARDGLVPDRERCRRGTYPSNSESKHPSPPSSARCGRPRPPSPAIEQGLETGYLQKILQLLGKEPVLRVLDISQRTLERRRHEGRLKPDESDRLYRLASLLALAADVLGSLDAAREWMTRPAVALGDRTPLQQTRNEAGAQRVESLLTRIEYGVYS